MKEKELLLKEIEKLQNKYLFLKTFLNTFNSKWCNKYWKDYYLDAILVEDFEKVNEITYNAIYDTTLDFMHKYDMENMKIKDDYVIHDYLLDLFYKEIKNYLKDLVKIRNQLDIN